MRHEDNPKVRLEGHTGRKVQRRVLRSFLAETGGAVEFGSEPMLKRGAIVTLDEGRALEYDRKGYTAPVPPRPTKEAAAAGAADHARQHASAAKKGTR